MGFRIMFHSAPSVDHKHHFPLPKVTHLSPTLSRWKYHCHRKSQGRQPFMPAIREAGWHRFGRKLSCLVSGKR